MKSLLKKVKKELEFAEEVLEEGIKDNDYYEGYIDAMEKVIIEIEEELKKCLQ